MSDPKMVPRGTPDLTHLEAVYCLYSLQTLCKLSVLSRLELYFHIVKV